MRKILLRAPKGPFDVVSAVETARRDTLATNAGNLVFSGAAYKLLWTKDTVVHVGQFQVRADEAAKVNETYDAFVVPLANAFRPSFERSLRALTRLIERLTIPVVVFGVGAQGNLDYGFGRLEPITETVKAFVRAVLARSPSIGVRGEYTRSYLEHLGFTDVDVIGCPSMFMNGPGFRIEPRASTLDRRAKVALTISPYVKEMGEIVMRHYERYPNLTYIPQNTRDLRLMLWGDLPQDIERRSRLPVYASHPLYREDKTRFFIDPWTWINYLRDFDFTFGTRIHGSIVSVLAGTPALVLAHDSRTLELARYFDLPHRLITDVEPDVDAAELYAAVDYTAFNAGYDARLTVMTDFLDKHGLDHNFRPGRSFEAFDNKLRKTRFPSPVRTRVPAGRSSDRLRSTIARLGLRSRRRREHPARTTTSGPE